MKKPSSQRLQNALVDAQIQPHLVLQIMNTMYGTVPRNRVSPYTDPAWDALYDGLQHERRMLVSNRSSRLAWIAPLYDEYAAIMHAVMARMVQKRLHPLPGQMSPPTLAEYTAYAKKENLRRTQEGKRSMGACDSQWPSWVPPHARADFCMRVQAAQDKHGQAKGNRFTPFMTKTLRTRNQQHANFVRSAIEGIRNTFSDAGCPYASTPYRALHLAAARMAELALNRLERGYKTGGKNMIDDPVPRSWMALLDKPMRERLREAAANPQGVSTEGIDHFYYPPAAGRRAEEAAFLLDPEGMDAQARVQYAKTTLAEQQASEEDPNAHTDHTPSPLVLDPQGVGRRHTHRRGLGHDPEQHS